MKFLIKIVSMVFVLSLPLLANGVATITALKGNVEIKSESVSINATLGASLNEKDSVITADKSKAQIIFNDETIVTVGKNSNFSISKYIFDDINEPVAEFSMIKGAMKAITGRIGKIAPQKFKVKTKTATIGIRGTNFTVIAMEDGSMRAYCTYGAISATIDGKSYSIAQGFYLTLSPDRKVSTSEFSAGELKDMNKNSFGEKQPLVGEVDKGVEPDNTGEDFESVVIKDVSEKTQDAIQTSDSQSPTISLHGWSADNDAATSMLYPKVNLVFTEDGSLFDSTNSWVEVLGKTNASSAVSFPEKDNWSFYLKSTPDDYLSKNEFSTSFSSVVLTPLSGSTSQNAQLLSSGFEANADLSPDDHMSWGVWNASVEYEYDDPQITGLQQASHYFQGLWVAGESASEAVISARTGFVNYSGEYRAIQDGLNTVETGTAYVNVDFGANTADLSIYGNSGNVGGTYTYTGMSQTGHAINGGTISGGSGSATGTANGTFYGPNGSTLGGNFSISDGTTTSVKGVFQVAEQTQSTELAL